MKKTTINSQLNSEPLTEKEFIELFRDTQDDEKYTEFPEYDDPSPSI